MSKSRSKTRSAIQLLIVSAVFCSNANAVGIKYFEKRDGMWRYKIMPFIIKCTDGIKYRQEKQFIVGERDHFRTCGTRHSCFVRRPDDPIAIDTDDYIQRNLLPPEQTEWFDMLYVWRKGAEGVVDQTRNDGVFKKTFTNENKFSASDGDRRGVDGRLKAINGAYSVDGAYVGKRGLKAKLRISYSTGNEFCQGKTEIKGYKL